VRHELRAACAAIRGGGEHDHAAAEHDCCHDIVPTEPDRPGASLDVVLEDQDGRAETFAGYFAGKPSLLAFFYTRCENPYKCSLTVTKLARLQTLIAQRGRVAELKLAAITYDPEFDLPARLRSYGTDRGMRFTSSARFFRATSGFPELSRHLGLGVNYGASTVNRHRIELYLLDAAGRTAASFTRLQWEPQAVLEAAERRFGLA
jgi:cytochrome oxidase Cu insertion factor (SCO1/SenC/PrrC family)